ncbi:MAG: hypothetical protein GXP55_25080 [Deltaproteobacteria bacterium]|nr:hypothetical protein [Deltaproteobacteria bacterium]
MKTRWGWVLGTLILMACGGGGGPEDAGLNDAAMDSSRADTGAGICSANAECDDGLFCNGAETCAPDDPTAAVDGCAPAEAACLAGQTCDEDADRCLTACDRNGDADGDGHDSIDCGGDDCDDADANRFPGNAEVCDADHDEDCDPATFGERDGDDDGYIDSACCNLDAAGSSVCGDDCDDGDATVHPSASEVCNGFDDDCNGMTDEGVIQSYFADCDGDGWGVGEATMGCSPPADPPSTCSVVSWAAADGDCDDADADAHPTATEICDGIDNDCDGAIDGSVAEAWCNDPAQLAAAHAASSTCSAGACTPDAGSCVGPFLSCDATPDCETDGATGRLHCGSCDNRCLWECVSGSCDDAIDVAAGAGFTCALRASGRVACWGRNDHGQLGDGTRANHSTLAEVPGIVDAIELDVDGSGRAGLGHSCALRATGGVLCWGLGDHGQLGDGTTTDSLSPIAVPGLTDAVHIAVGFGHTCAIHLDGSISCWGRNDYGQLGDGTTVERLTPVTVIGIDDAVEIGAGGGNLTRYLTCARRASGHVACWGSNINGQLGDGTTHDTCPGGTDCSALPVTVAGLSGATSLTVGAGHACVISAAGPTLCWGRNLEQQLGNGSSANSSTPVAVSGLPAVSASAGRFHSCAIRASGQAVCWGNRGGFAAPAPGVLGNNTLGGSATAVDVLGLGDATAIAAGHWHSCAISASQGVLCWGVNTSGELGTGDLLSTKRPVPVVGAGWP